MPLTLFVATTNPGKLRDFAASITASDIRLEALPDLASLPVPPEDAPTFAENAATKALSYALHAPGALVLADDSGLEVDALHGAPGVRSARFADDQNFTSRRALSPDQRNNLCLLDKLATTREADRTARYRCALALARLTPGATAADLLLSAEGTVEGEILAIPRGNAGFGYDPLFLLPEDGLSMGELALADRQHHSHRGRALAALLAQLRADHRFAPDLSA